MKDMAIGTVCYTASAGNHAQGMAYAGKLYGIRVIIFIPEETDITKIDAIKRIGGDWITLVIAGKSYDEAYRLATKECQAKDGTFISAFDHIDIIAGQGTSALEFLQQQTDLDILYVPVGGGGLIAGYLAAKLHLGHPVKIIGVEPSAAPSASFALAARMPVTIRTTATVAEGAKVARIGDLPFRIMQENHVEIIQVSEPEILSAMDLLHRKEDILVEGAGALPLAGLVKQLPEIGANENVGLVLSGGNISIRRIGEAYGYAA
jgi:threonine dehydratase